MGQGEYKPKASTEAHLRFVLLVLTQYRAIVSLGKPLRIVQGRNPNKLTYQCGQVILDEPQVT
jgi:hypothetical protein